MPPVLEERYVAHNDCGYEIVNEAPELYRSFIKDMKFERALSIASAGEVLLFGILPYVTKELIGIDHSYRSLGVTMTKIILLEQLGLEVKKFWGGDEFKVLKKLKEIEATLPKALCDARPFKGSGQYCYVEHKNYLGFELIKKEWDMVPDEIIQACINNLDKLKLFHGDITDFYKDGPFDLFYLSNADGHINRNGYVPSSTNSAHSRFKTWADNLVKEGGHVLHYDAYIMGSLSSTRTTPGYELVAKATTSRALSPHVLYKRVK